MSATSSSLIVPTDPPLASVIIANMLENWLDSSPHAWTTPEVTDEPENLRTAEEQTGLHLCASVDPGASAPPSGEYRAILCAAAESSRTGLERTVDPHPRSGFGNMRCSYDGAHGLQDPGSGCFHWTGGGGVCLEASRLARSNADWHRLLELGRYDPAGFNDGYCWDSRARWRKRSCTSSARASWAGNSTKRKKENCDFHSVELCHDEDGHVHPIALSPLAATLTKNTRVV